jgi:glyoxylase-like metal-dependent hydrolase (beta-lactamase superfamily II)
MLARMRRLVLLLLLAASASATDIFDLRLQKVVDGVYVASRAEPLRPYVEGNVTIIINERDVVVVDAGGSPCIARNIIAEIRKLTPNPVSTLIYTHIHRDHRFGTQEFVKAYPGIEIVAHSIVRNVIDSDDGKFVAGRIARLEANREEAAKEIAQLRAAGNEAVARHLERYRDAVVVYLPKGKVVVAGDMVVHPFPHGFSTQPLEWIATMEKLAALDFGVQAGADVSAFEREMTRNSPPAPTHVDLRREHPRVSPRSRIRSRPHARGHGGQERAGEGVGRAAPAAGLLRRMRARAGGARGDGPLRPYRGTAAAGGTG